MAFIKTIPVSEADGAVREIYQSAQDEWGFVPDYAKVFCHRPDVMKHWGKLLATIKLPLDERRLELATFAAASALRHTPCSLAHGAKLAGIIGQDAVIALARGEDSAVLSETEKAIVRFARQIARDAAMISRDDVDALKNAHGLSDAEIFDIAAVAASRSFFTKLLDALGTDADSALGDIDTNLRDALAIGRPISQAPLEALPTSTGA